MKILAIIDEGQGSSFLEIATERLSVGSWEGRFRRRVDPLDLLGSRRHVDPIDNHPVDGAAGEVKRRCGKEIDGKRRSKGWNRGSRLDAAADEIASWQFGPQSFGRRIGVDRTLDGSLTQQRIEQVEAVRTGVPQFQSQPIDSEAIRCGS